jgi:transposase
VSFIEGSARDQVSLLPPCIDDYVATDPLVQVVDAFVASLNLTELGFDRTVAAATGRPGYHPGDMLRLYVWGNLNQVRSSRHLERACARDLEALWLLRKLAPDYRTIASFRHDNPEAIVGASAAFIRFCFARPAGGARAEADGGHQGRTAQPAAARMAPAVDHAVVETAPGPQRAGQDRPQGVDGVPGLSVSREALDLRSAHRSEGGGMEADQLIGDPLADPHASRLEGLGDRQDVLRGGCAQGLRPALAEGSDRGGVAPRKGGDFACDLGGDPGRGPKPACSRPAARRGPGRGRRGGPAPRPDVRAAGHCRGARSGCWPASAARRPLRLR